MAISVCEGSFIHDAYVNGLVVEFSDTNELVSYPELFSQEDQTAKRFFDSLQLIHHIRYPCDVLRGKKFAISCVWFKEINSRLQNYLGIVCNSSLTAISHVLRRYSLIAHIPNNADVLLTTLSKRYMQCRLDEEVYACNELYKSINITSCADVRQFNRVGRVLLPCPFLFNKTNNNFTAREAADCYRWFSTLNDLRTSTCGSGVIQDINNWFAISGKSKISLERYNYNIRNLEMNLNRLQVELNENKTRLLQEKFDLPKTQFCNTTINNTNQTSGALITTKHIDLVLNQQKEYWKKLNETLHTSYFKAIEEISKETNNSLFHLIVDGERKKILHNFYNNTNSQLNWTTANNLLRERDEALAKRDNCTHTITMLTNISNNIASQCVVDERTRIYVENCEREIHMNQDLLHNSLTYSLANYTKLKKCNHELNICMLDVKKSALSCVECHVLSKNLKSELLMKDMQIESYNTLLEACREENASRNCYAKLENSYDDASNLRNKLHLCNTLNDDYKFLNNKQSIELEELSANYDDVVRYKQMFLELNEVRISKQLEMHNVTCETKINEAVSVALLKSSNVYNSHFNLLYGLEQTVETEDCEEEIARNVSLAEVYTPTLKSLRETTQYTANINCDVQRIDWCIQYMSSDMPPSSIDVLRYFNVTRKVVYQPSCENRINRLNESAHVMRLLTYNLFGREEKYTGETSSALEICRIYIAQDRDLLESIDKKPIYIYRDSSLPLPDLPHVEDVTDTDDLQTLLLQRDLQTCRYNLKELEVSNAALLNMSDILLRKWYTVKDTSDFTETERDILNDIKNKTKITIPLETPSYSDKIIKWIQEIIYVFTGVVVTFIFFLLTGNAAATYKINKKK